MTSIEEKNSVLGLFVDFAKIEQTPQLINLFTEDRLRMIMEERKYWAADTVLVSVGSCTDGSLTFVERCDWTQMNAFYTKSVNKLLLDHSRAA